MTPGPGWYRDPYFLKHERYWDNGWTDQVRRVEVEQPALGGQPAPPARAPTPDIAANDVGAPRTADAAAVAAGTAARPSDGEQHTASWPMSAAPGSAIGVPTGGEPAPGKTPIVHDDDTLAVPAVSRRDDTATVAAVSTEVDTLVVPAVFRNDSGGLRSAHGPVGAPSNGAAVLPSQLPPWDPGVVSGEEAAALSARARHRRLGLVGAALVLVALVVVASILATGGSPSKSASNHGHPGSGTASAAGRATADAGGTRSLASATSPSAAESVTTVATRSLGKKSVVASVALVPTSSTRGTPQHLSGSGEFSLDSGLGTFSISAAGAKVQEQKFVFQGNILYVNVANSPVPGKQWVVASTNDVPALGPGSSLSNFMEEMGNPGMLVQQLTATPLSVVSLGGSSVGGTPVQKYEVTFSVSSTGSTSASLGTNTSEEVDVAANQLVKQIVIPVRVYGQNVQQNIVVSFSHYGKPISVGTPPFSQLISLSQYLTGPAPPSA